MKRRLEALTRMMNIVRNIMIMVALLLPATVPAGAEDIKALPEGSSPSIPEQQLPAADPSSISAGGRLTLEQCIDIAHKRSPKILAASNAVNASRSRVGQARSDYYPQINLSSGYTRAGGSRSVGGSVFSGRYDQYTGSVALTQNLFDFGKSWAQVDIQQRNLDASREDLRDVTAGTVFNVKQSYYGLLQAEKNRDVLRETVKSFEQHLEQAKGFFEAGVKSRFDVTKAEVDLSNARLNLIRGENALRIARVTMNNAMGVPDAPEYSIEDSLSFQKNSITFEEARERAFANRPDLRSSSAKIEASEASLSLARKGHLPTLSGSASYTRVDEAYPPEQSGWSAGLTLTFPLFSGFLTSYQIREAKENLNVLKANDESLRQDIVLEVQQAYLSLREAEERVGVAELTVKQAQENYEIARGRYEAGVGSPIEETDALVSLSNAKTNYISALSDYKIAEAALGKAMGE